MANVKYENFFVNEIYHDEYVKVLERGSWIIPGVTVNSKYIGDANGGQVNYTLGIDKTPIKNGSGIYKDADAAESSNGQVTMQINNPMFLSEFIPVVVETTTLHSTAEGTLNDQAASFRQAESVDGAGIVIADITTNVVTGALAGVDGIYNEIIDLRTALRKAGANPKVLVVSEDVEGVLVKSPNFLRSTDMGDRTVTEGAIGRIGGMDVFVATIGDNNQYFMYDPYYLGFARNLIGMDVVPAPKAFGSYCKSGLNFGIKALRESAFGVKKTTVVAAAADEEETE